MANAILTERQQRAPLSAHDWCHERELHRRRLNPVIEPVLARRLAGKKHPVVDFLFEYYSFRPAHLLRWSPGWGVVVKRASDAPLDWPGLWEPALGQVSAGRGGVWLNPASFPAQRWKTLRWIVAYLRQVVDRPPRFGCHGLHEWAMVYRLNPEEIRHSQLPLRLSPGEIAKAVEFLPLTCTHFDAFRFFTPPARPLNSRQLTRETQPEIDQPGCLHANMDLYKWAYKLAPWTPSDLIADCFEFALRAREIDMRASPYDLGEVGYAAIRIETAEGREEYEREQRQLAEAAQPLRRRLLGCYEGLAAAAGLANCSLPSVTVTPVESDGVTGQSE